MEKKTSIKKNFIMNAILTMSGFIFPMISFPYIAPILGPDGVGSVRFATSVVAYFAMFAQLGIPSYGIRICAKNRDDKEKLSQTVQELLIINVVMNVIVYALFFLSLAIVPKFAESRTLLIIISSSIAFSTFGLEYLYRGLEQYSYITIRSLIFKVIALAAMFLLIRSKDDYIIYGAITILASVGSNVLNLINSRKLISLKKTDRYNFRQHMKPILMFFAMSCATTIYLNLDGVMLGFMTSDADVGYYDAAVKLKTILVSIVTSLGAVLLPRSSYYVESGKIDDFRKITEKAFGFVAIVAAPLAIYFTLFAREGILFLSGEKFLPSILAMKIIMPTVLFIGLTNIMGLQVMVPVGKEKLVLYSEIVGAVVDLVLNAILIPRMQSAGAALGTTVAEFSVLVVQVCYMRKYISEVSLEQSIAGISLWKIAIGVLLALASSSWVKFLEFSGVIDSIMLQNLLLLGISAMLFFGIYFLVLLVLKDKYTYEMYEQIMSRFKKGEAK